MLTGLGFTLWHGNRPLIAITAYAVKTYDVLVRKHDTKQKTKISCDCLLQLRRMVDILSREENEMEIVIICAVALFAIYPVAMWIGDNRYVK